MDLSNPQNLTREQITSEEIIREIFAEEDEVTRESTIVKIQSQAKQIGCKTEFDKLIKAQRHQIKEARKELEEKQRQVAVSNIYQCVADDDTLIEFKTGRWLINETGVTAQAYRETIVASRYPIIISKRLINKETGKSKLEITWWINRIRKSITVDRSNAMSNSKIVALADYDFPASSETSRSLVSFLSDFESFNIGVIPTEISTSKFGWSDDEFVPYTNKIIFDGSTAYKALVDSVVSAGDYEAWKQEICKIRSSGRKEPLVYLAASFGSVLLKLINIAPFIVNLYGATSKGKTVSLMMAASIWANPAGRGYIAESTSTANSLEIRQGILNHLPLMIDDLSKIRDKDKDKFVDLIYMLCAGGGKNRLNRNIEMRDTSTWDNIILTNIERPLTDETMQGGAVNRVLDFEIQEGDIFKEGEGNEVVTVLSENYGFAGKKFIECIQFIGRENIPDLIKGYEKKIREAALKSGERKEEKQVTPLAVLMLADEIAETMIFKDGVRLDMDYCLENIKSREQVSEMQRAYDHFIDACTINRSKFDDGDYGDTWGVWRGDYIYIIPAALELIAKQYSFSVKQFVEWCKNECLLDYDKGEKRNKKRIQLGGDYKKRIRCYGIRSSMDGAKIANDDDFIPGEPDMESEEPLPFALP
jgi:uncharacterized protein (DUF927 family)